MQKFTATKKEYQEDSHVFFGVLSCLPSLTERTTCPPARLENEKENEHEQAKAAAGAKAKNKNKVKATYI